MTTFTVISATETDVVALGQSRADVREALGAYRTLRRTPDSEEADYFVDNVAMATYSPSDELALIEMHEPALVLLDGVQLIGETLDDPVDALARQGIDMVRGLSSPGGS